MAEAGIPIAGITCRRCPNGGSAHLDGPVERRPPPAQHEQAQDGDAIAEVVDEGHVVDERVRVSHKQDNRRGPVLGEDRAEGWPPTCLLQPCRLSWGCGLRSGGHGEPWPSPLPLWAARQGQSSSLLQPTLLVAWTSCPTSQGPSTYADKEGRDRGAASDVDHGQQAGQVPFSGSREAQPRVQRWVGAVSRPWAFPLARSWISALDLIALLLSPLIPCSRPQQPTGQFFPPLACLPLAFCS